VPIYNLANGDSLQVPPSNIDGEWKGQIRSSCVDWLYEWKKLGTEMK
jgi:hypothetical protein